uniref:Esterase n=1 Tax=Holotrichia oblita TaxID=644536 RepID=E6Y8N1_HOLOL|nr:esterase [Holotrichia oblita]
MKLLSVIPFIFLFSECISQNYIIEIDQGKLNGTTKYDRKGGVFYSFQSIPYGKPPVGELRFKVSQPADKWDGVRDASVDMPMCYQLIDWQNRPQSEDCLYLNVYTPQLLPSSEVGFLGCPIIETQTENRTVFLPDKPISLIQQGTFNHVSLLIGYNDIDGAGSTDIYTETVNLVLRDLGIEAGTQEAADFIDRIEDFYMTSGLFDEPLVQMYTDIWFGYPPYRAAKEQQKVSNSSIYFYKFSADTALNLHKAEAADLRQYKGAVHSDELCYIFNSTKHNNITIEPGSVEDIAIDRVVKLWTNFVKYGNPTPDNTASFEWASITNDIFNYVDIGTKETVPGTNPDETNMIFWETIYEEYLSK